MNATLKTIKGLCEQAEREPEKAIQILAMITRLIRESRSGKRKPSKGHREMGERELERSHRRRITAARELDRHLQEKPSKTALRRFLDVVGAPDTSKASVEVVRQ